MKLCIALMRTIVLGGDANSVHGLARHLEELGVDVTLLMPRTRYEVPYEKTRFLPLEWTRLKSPLTAAAFVKAAREMGREADLVHCHLPVPGFGLVSDLISRGGGPVVTTFGTPLIERNELKLGANKSLPHYLARFFISNRRIAKLSRFSSRRFFVSTRYQEKQLLGLGAPSERIRVIPNLATQSKNPKPKSQARKSLGLKGGIVTYIGHLTPSKGVDVLIKSFPFVLKEFPETTLVLAWSGSGTDRPYRKLVSSLNLRENVLFLGKVDVPSLLSAADVLCLPYLYNFGTNLFPSIMLESFRQGVPLVSSDLPVIREIAEKGTAILTKPGSPDSVANGIIKLLGNQKIRKNMESAQRNAFKEKFHPKKLARLYLKEYEAVLNG